MNVFTALLSWRPSQFPIQPRRAGLTGRSSAVHLTPQRATQPVSAVTWTEWKLWVSIDGVAVQHEESVSRCPRANGINRRATLLQAWSSPSRIAKRFAVFPRLTYGSSYSCIDSSCSGACGGDAAYASAGRPVTSVLGANLLILFELRDTTSLTRHSEEVSAERCRQLLAVVPAGESARR